MADSYGPLDPESPLRRPKSTSPSPIRLGCTTIFSPVKDNFALPSEVNT
jgi:hypothetical protein